MIFYKKEKKKNDTLKHCIKQMRERERELIMEMGVHV